MRVLGRTAIHMAAKPAKGGGRRTFASPVAGFWSFGGGGQTDGAW